MCAFNFFIAFRDLLGWAILLNFLVYVTLPLQLIFLGLSIGCITYFICLSLPVGYSHWDSLLSNQLAANAVLIATAALIGLLYYFMGEAKQKRAFLEAKKSLEVKMVIEEQSAEQVCILFYWPWIWNIKFAPIRSVCYCLCCQSTWLLRCGKIWDHPVPRLLKKYTWVGTRM